MKVGYTPTEAYNMFRSLRREVFDFFDYQRPLSFGVRSPETGIFADGAIAHCDFSSNPDLKWHYLDKINEFASGVRFNADYLPHLYEDEMLIILLHELCHATAGWCSGDGHGKTWQDMARQVGTIPEPTFLPRNWKIVWPENHYSHQWAKEQVGPTMDVYAGHL